MSSAHVATLLRRSDPSLADTGVRELIELDDEATALPDTFVHRPALVDHLTAGPEAALVVIVAPSGYGKSSLLADWALVDGRRFVWLVPGRPGRFGERRSGLEAVAAAQDSENAGCVFVLDDAHRLNPEVLHRLVCEVLSALHAGSTLVLASRRELELPLALLQTHRAVIELRARDLALAEPEASQLLQNAGLDIAPDNMPALLDRTEGWPAALYLAALGTSADDPAPRGATLTQYVSDEVLAAVPEHLLSVARRTSILEDLSAAACDAVLVRRGCSRDLVALAHNLPLLRALDAEGTRYRWHPLIRDALLSELRVVEPELELGLHQRASDWYLTCGDVDRAVEHACAAGDVERAGDAAVADDPGLPRRWTPDSDPDLALTLARAPDRRLGRACRIGSALRAGRRRAGRRPAMEAARDGGHRSPRMARHAAPGLSAGLAVIDAAGATSGVAAMRASADPACRRSRPTACGSRWCRALSGVAAYLAGDLDTADEMLDEADCPRRQRRARGGRAVPGPAGHDRVAPPRMGAGHRSCHAGDRGGPRPRAGR